jgi:hypothetical protein
MIDDIGNEFILNALNESKNETYGPGTGYFCQDSQYGD